MRRKAPRGEGLEPSRPWGPAVGARPADSAAEGSRQEGPGELPQPGGAALPGSAGRVGFVRELLHTAPGWRGAGLGPPALPCPRGTRCCPAEAVRDPGRVGAGGTDAQAVGQEVWQHSE